MPIGFLKNRFVGFLQEFIHDSRNIGIMLVVCTAVSLVIANTAWGVDYLHFFEKDYDWFHEVHLPHSISHWINDGLMAIFFFLVGMEIKRELLMGELSTPKQALLPIAAAIGGMVVPAFIYSIFNRGTEFAGGWGVPMATDIAFSLGVASMLGKRCPSNLKIFLTALAIIDDLGAILVIAFFYGDSIQGWYLLGGLVLLILSASLRKHLRKAEWLHWLFFAGLWYCIFNSGIHATVAGVLFAFTIPTAQLPRLEMALHNWVNFGILPVFALANTAIVVNSNMTGGLASSLGLGIMLGLLVGKPLGIFGACWLMVRNKAAELPRGVSWNKLIGAGILGGIGFTMSIFIVGLAFPDAATRDTAKIAILLSALISVLLSFVWFSIFTSRKARQDPKDPSLRTVGLAERKDD